jgi:uncharacterized membrane protein
MDQMLQLLIILIVTVGLINVLIMDLLHVSQIEHVLVMDLILLYLITIIVLIGSPLVLLMEQLVKLGHAQIMDKIL